MDGNTAWRSESTVTEVMLKNKFIVDRINKKLKNSAYFLNAPHIVISICDVI